MKKWIMFRTARYCSSIAFFLLLGNTLAAQETFVCVWRNPERTMTRLFPEARDYRTVTVPITAAQLAAIEEKSGAPVLPGQREQFQYYAMLDAKGQTVGYTAAVTQKGEFGAIEFVFGLDTQFRIKTLYIQRSRERRNRFKEESFLRQFVGKGLPDAASLRDPSGNTGNHGTRAVVAGLRKELAAFAVLVAK